MPPRTVKKSSAVAPPKKTIRAVRSTPKSQNQSEAPDESVKVEKSSVAVLEVKEEFKAEQISEEQLSDKAPAPGSEKETPKSGAEPQSETKPDVNGSATQEMETEVKEFVEEYEKDERLELEDNDAEYDPEEEGGVDYDEKEIEEGDVHEDGDEAEDDPDEENVGEEEEGDMAEEEMEDVPEELEGEEEEEEHAGEEHEGAQSIDIDEEEHHEVVKERRKRKEFEIFVGGLDKDATEDDLRKVFSQVGDVTEVRLMMNTLTKKNKGFAFLRYSTIEQAKRAVAELKNPVVKGKQCGVTPSQDSDTLFLGNICKTWTKEALKEKLKQYGIENVEDLTLVEDNNNEGMNRGFAFLEFSSRSDAMDAFKRLQKRDVAFGIDRPAKVSFADSFIDPGDEIMAQVKTVFVDGLLPSWDEDRVRDLLKKYGELEKVELARNMPSAKRKDFGFVTFDSHEAAVSCAKSINNSELGEGDNKAKVRARLSRPLQRGKGRPLTRPDFHYPRGGGRGGVRGPWARPPPRSYSGRGGRGFGPRFPPPHVKRMVGLRERRPAIVPPARARPLAHPSRSYERRPPVSSYPKSSLKREYGMREEFPSRRTALEYGSRAVPDRRMSYRDDYVGEPAYNELPRSAPRSAARRAYQDDGYGRRPPPAYREGRAHDYDSLSGSKRPYAALDDVPARYADPGVRPSRARIDYELGGGSHYADTYGDRYGRSNAGYGGGRTSLSTQDSHGLYGSRQGVNYGGSLGGSDAGRMYSSSYGGDYASRGSDVGGGSSYSSLYSNRGAGGSGYMGSGGSGSYY